jgi:hypothetical protein
MAFDVDSGESDVRDRFDSLGLKNVRLFVGGNNLGTYSSDPSLEPRFRPLAPRFDSAFALASCLLTSSILFKTSSSYSASREFIVVLRFWFVSFAEGLDGVGSSSCAGK